MKAPYLFVLTIWFFSACSKPKGDPSGNPSTPVTPENLATGDFTVKVDSVFDNRVVISWTKSIDPENDTVRYDIWLNNKLIVADLTGLSSSLTELAELTSYNGKVIARDTKNNKIERTFSFTTEKFYLRFRKLYTYDQYVDALNPGGGETKQLLKMQDGSYIIVGSSYIDGSYANGGQIFVMKTDYEGNEIWKKHYPYTVGPAWDVAATESSTGVLVASHWNLLSIDNNGNLLWHKKIMGYDNGDGGSEIRSVKQDGNGQIIIVGGRAAPEQDIQQQGVVTKLDQSGNILWEKELKSSFYSFFYDVQVNASNEIIALGIKETSGMTWEQYLNGSTIQIDFCLLKLSAQGDVIWQKTYGDDRLDVPSKLILKSNGNYVFVGTSEGTSYRKRMFETSPDGTEIRNLTYGHTSSFALGVAETQDGGLVTTGFADATDAKVLEINKFTAAGTEEWNQEVYEMGEFLFGRAILQESDGGYRIAASQAKYYGYGNPAHIAIYKTDPLGRYK